MPDDGTSTDITLDLNGEPRTATGVDHRASLLDLVHDRFGLTGSKKGCDHGQCGACTMLLDGRRVVSCLVLAAAADGAAVTTVEGLAGPGGEPGPLQQAFIEHDGFQCGFCTPGQLCSAAGVLREAADGHPSAVTPPGAVPPAPAELTAAEIRERMSGNLCRCGAYPGIVAAVGEVAAR